LILAYSACASLIKTPTLPGTAIRCRKRNRQLFYWHEGTREVCRRFESRPQRGKRSGKQESPAFSPGVGLLLGE
jgi:hypothetical protein